MKLACLVLAYTAAPVLQVTVPFYKAAGWDVFVHIDPKAGQDKYLAALGNSTALCHIIPDAAPIFWGGYTMMEAEIKLLNAARRSGPYDKYLLLSDDSFPILPSAALQQHFSADDDQVSIQRQVEGSPFLSRYKSFYCYDHEATTPLVLPQEGRDFVLRPIDQNLETRIAEIAVLRRNGKKKLDVYYGPQFWALTAKTVDSVLSIIENDWYLAKSFEYSALPDEIMFQSVIGNYVHQKSIDTAPVYVDFSGGGVRVIKRSEELPRDLQPPHAFIRKFSSNDPSFLSEMAAHLKAGKTVFGTLPGVPQTVQQTIEASGRSHTTVRLTAPAENAGPAWHGIETFWGRRYRWTAAEQVKWNVAADVPTPGRVRFVITTVVSSGEAWMEGCHLVFNNRSAPMHLSKGELSAEFDHDGFTMAELELYTPELILPSEAYGSHDTRRLGLSVAL